MAHALASKAAFSTGNGVPFASSVRASLPEISKSTRASVSSTTLSPSVRYARDESAVTTSALSGATPKTLTASLRTT
jgi:hypothetical protein